MKDCVTCQVPKPLSEFHRNRSTDDGYAVLCSSCQNDSSRRSYRKNYRTRRSARYEALYGITLEQYEAMFDEQQGLCALCDQPEVATYKGKQKWLAVDHCHETGRVRGLLCFKCNTALGRVADTPEAAWKLLAYLEGE